MLLNNTQFNLLRCPISHQPLLETEPNLLSNAEKNITYPIVNGQPVLIDFDNSVLDRTFVIKSSGSSLINRSRYGKLSKFKALLAHPSKITRNNFSIFSKELQVKPETHPLVLVIGGGAIGNGSQEFYSNPNIDIIGTDIYATPNTKVVADAHNLPFIDACFDGVVIQAVLEHVVEPAKVVEEIFRVLKPTGIVFADTPFMQPVHEGAYDFTRFSITGHRFLFRRFDKIASGYSSGTSISLLWAIEYFFRGLFRSFAIGKLFRLAFIWLRLFDFLIPQKNHHDSACGVFLSAENRKKCYRIKTLFPNTKEHIKSICTKILLF